VTKSAEDTRQGDLVRAREVMSPSRPASRTSRTRALCPRGAPEARGGASGATGANVGALGAAVAGLPKPRSGARKGFLGSG